MILDPEQGLETLDLAPAGAPGLPTGEATPGERELNLRDVAEPPGARAAAGGANRRAGGVRKDAARLLGIDPRNLSYYLRKHELDATDE